MSQIYARKGYANKKKVYNKTKKTTSTKKAIASNRRSNFNKRVMAVLSRTNERKLKVVNLINTGEPLGSGIKFITGTTTHTGLVVAPLSLFALANGAQQDQRIGNKITNTYLNIRGFVHSKIYDSSTNAHHMPFEVHILCYKNKHDRSGDFMGLKQGINNASEQLSGSAMSSLRPWNKDEYIIKSHKIMKLNAMPEIITSTSGPVVNAQVGRNPVMRRFSYRVPIAKTLVYKDGENVPVNDWVHIGVYVVDCGGDELAVTDKRCTIQMDGYLTFTDA